MPCPNTTAAPLRNAPAPTNPSGCAMLQHSRSNSSCLVPRAYESSGCRICSNVELVLAGVKGKLARTELLSFDVLPFLLLSLFSLEIQNPHEQDGVDLQGLPEDKKNISINTEVSSLERRTLQHLRKIPKPEPFQQTGSDHTFSWRCRAEVVGITYIRRTDREPTGCIKCTDGLDEIKLKIQAFPESSGFYYYSAICVV